MSDKLIKIGVLAYEQCTSSMILGVVDILSFANIESQSQSGKELFEIEIITRTGNPVRSFSKFPIQPHSGIKSNNKNFDLIYIPGFLGDLEEILQREQEIISWLKSQFKEGVRMAAACNGNFLLAETGALNGKKATTHWSLTNAFKSRYKETELKPDRILEDSGDTISAAGVTAYFNLALYLIEQYGSKDLSLTCAKVFLVDSGRRIQTPYQMYQVSKKHGDRKIIRVQDWLEKNYKEQITLDMMMEIANLSKKTLIRRFKRATGDTPISYLQKLRIEIAKKLLASENYSFNEVTWEVGYNDVSTFHQLFKSETGVTPNEYRSKFSIVKG